MRTTLTTPLEKELDAALHTMLEENDALRAENQRLISWIMGDEPDALTALQRVYSDPKTDVPNVIKSAIGALPFERAKPASVSVVIDFKEKVRNIRLRTLEQDRARWAAEDAVKTIEHQPTTVLGEGQGQHGAWHPLDHDDPAA
jgi:hypothetical protein